MRRLKIIQFYTKKNLYLFDGVTGIVMAADALIIDCIIEMTNEKDFSIIFKILNEKYHDEYKVRGVMTFVKEFSERTGAFYVEEQKEKIKIRRARTFGERAIKKIHSAGYLQQIILNITEDCNMRCSYCYLAEGYQYTRNRTVQKMDMDVAIAALQRYFAEISRIKEYNPGKKCAITFYGGEALINFKVIKKCIEYAKTNCPVEPIFNITTNGILLKGDVADFLVKNNVNITISFDGTKENHDRNRIDAWGRGTYDRIRENVCKIIKKYPDYHKLNFAGVYDFKTNLSGNDEFFQEHSFPVMGYLSAVSDLNTKYYDRFSTKDRDRFAKEYLEMIQKYMSKKIHNQKISSYLEMLIELPLAPVLLRTRSKDKKLPILPYTSACIPGMKISVRVDGTIDLCEKINSTMPIGTVDNGYNYSAIRDVVKKYNETLAEGCLNCPINRQCGMCFAFCCEDGCFKKPNCQSIINSYTNNLSIVYSVLEENPNAYAKFEFKEEWFGNV